MEPFLKPSEVGLGWNHSQAVARLLPSLPCLQRQGRFAIWSLSLAAFLMHGLSVAVPTGLTQLSWPLLAEYLLEKIPIASDGVLNRKIMRINQFSFA